MCGRYAFFSPAEAVKRAFALDDFPALEPRYNIAPPQPVPVLDYHHQKRNHHPYLPEQEPMMWNQS